MSTRSVRAAIDREKQSKGLLGFRSSKQLSFGDARKKATPSKLQDRSSLVWGPARCSTPSKRDGERLPERLALLEEFYNAMETSISLLRIRQDVCTFSAISKSVESTTHRRFLQSHVAQIKYLIPEVLQIEPYTSWDAEAQCSRRDFKITMIPLMTEGEDPLQRYKSPSRTNEMVARQQEFRKRLLEFSKKNPKTLDVPNATIFDRAHSDEPADTTSEEKPELLKHSSVTPENSDCDLSLEDDAHLGPIPVAFDLSMLKKFPRSPKKANAFRALKAKNPLRHLQENFRRHFSAKPAKPVDVKDPSLDIENARVTENDSFTSPAKPVFSVGVTSPVKAHFSIKSRKKILPVVEPESQKTDVENQETQNSYSVKKADEETETVSIINTYSSADGTKSNESEQTNKEDASNSVSEPPAFSLGVSSPIKARFSLRTRKIGIPDSPASVSYDRVLTTPRKSHDECPSASATPCQAILTPGVDIKTPLAAATAVTSKKGPPPTSSPPMRTRKSSVIKSLRFAAASNEDSNASKSTIKAAKEPETPKSTATPGSMLSPGRSALKRHLPFDAADELLMPQRKKLLFGNTLTEALFQKTSSENLSASDMDVLKCLPQELLNDVQAKEKKIQHETQIGLENTKRKQRLISTLPKFFNMVRLIFQSASRAVLPRKDLMQSILSSHPDITDHGEIIEQLQLLVEIAPEWISVSQSASNTIYKINKAADLKAVSRAIGQAK